MDLIEKIEKYNGNNRCTVFGAGKYGKLLVEYISRISSEKAIQNIVVSEKQGNPSKIGNIQVVDIKDDNLEDIGQYDIFIAVSVDKQNEIRDYLLKLGINDRFIIRLTNEDILKLEEDNFSSSVYWEERYKNGGNSGSGSYNRLAEFKAQVINNFVKENDIYSVIEWGCGDGNQLQYFNFPHYVGYDISKTVIEQIKTKYAEDKYKEFYWTGDVNFSNDRTAEMSMSLDVIYHLVEDTVFKKYMSDLFKSAKKYICIYSWDQDVPVSSHVKYRKFTEYIEKNFKDWKLVLYIKNKYFRNEDEQDIDNTSLCDFYFYEKK